MASLSREAPWKVAGSRLGSECRESCSPQGLGADGRAQAVGSGNLGVQRLNSESWASLEPSVRRPLPDQGRTKLQQSNLTEPAFGA